MNEQTEKVETEQGYIKLYRNETAKAVKFNWEIKAYASIDKEQYAQLIASIEELNSLMEAKFHTEIL